MRVNRRLLYWGVFFVALGGVLVTADLGAVNSTTILDALRLWPLAIVAIGLGLVLRRTRFSLPGGLLAAAAPGLLLGGGFALAPRVAVDCGGGAASSSTIATHQGVFDGPARVSVTTGCGDLVVGTAQGSDWQLDAGSTGSRTPVIDATGRSLSIEAGGRHGWSFAFDSDGSDRSNVLTTSRDTWHLTLPTAAIDDASFEVNAGAGHIDLPGARMGHLDVTSNAAKTDVDLSGATLASLTGEVNAGMLSVTLPAGSDLTGTLEANAGELQVCAPAGLGVRVHHTGALSSFSAEGGRTPGSDWESPDYASATYHADLTIEVNLGNVEIDPIGGCK